MMNNKAFTGFLAFQDLEVKYNRLGLDPVAVRKEKLAPLLGMLQLGKTWRSWPRKQFLGFEAN